MKLKHILEGQALRLVHSGHRSLNLRQQRGIERDPFAFEADESFSSCDQLSKFSFGEVDITDGDAPIEIDDRIETEQRLAAAAFVFAGADLGAQARLFPAGGFPPRRQQHLPACFQQPLALGCQEPPSDGIAERFGQHVAASREALGRQTAAEALQPSRGAFMHVGRPCCRPQAVRLAVIGEPDGNKRGFIALVLKDQLQPPRGFIPLRLQQLKCRPERRGVRLPANGDKPCSGIHARCKGPASIE
ncbi:hypothetical protein D3C76_528980 [compost metagenome]